MDCGIHQASRDASRFLHAVCWLSLRSGIEPTPFKEERPRNSCEFEAVFWSCTERIRALVIIPDLGLIVNR